MYIVLLKLSFSYVTNCYTRSFEYTFLAFNNITMANRVKAHGQSPRSLEQQSILEMFNYRHPNSPIKAW